MGFHSYIRAVGTGPKSNRELTKNETIDAIESILNQSVHSEQIAAFLLGWRVRLETVEELKTTLEVCNKYIKRVKIPNSIELGYPFDGKADNPYLLPLIPKYLKNLYPAAVEGTILDGSELEIEVLPANGLCKDCNKVFNVVINKGICPNCDTKNWELLSGKEFYIKEISCC